MKTVTVSTDQTEDLAKFRPRQNMKYISTNKIYYETEPKLNRDLLNFTRYNSCRCAGVVQHYLCFL